MKKLIITESQLFELLGDGDKSQVQFTGQNAMELGQNAQEKYNDATRAGLKGDAISMVGRTPNNNATDKDEFTVEVDTNSPNLRDGVTKAVQNAVNNGADINKMVVQGNAEDINNGTNENKVLTKKQMIENRIKHLNENAIFMNKRQLRKEIESR